jgi:NAD(P)-dependent dehydrogenase (short-subunit alcohol dehydrogenase family)
MLAWPAVPSVLVTGASTGIGRSTALRLDAAGWRVFAGVRKAEDADSLRAEATERLSTLMLDVTDAAQISTAAEEIGEKFGSQGLDGLVNNAGIVVPGPLETLPVDDFRRQIEINLTGQLAVTQALLPAVRAARGRIVFTSSIGGRIAFPMFGAYHVSKFGLEAVGDVFRQELRPWVIKVVVIEPGSIATPLWDRGDTEVDAITGRAGEGHADLYGKTIARYRHLARKTGARGIPPEKVAARIEHALTTRRPRSRYLVGADAKGQALAVRFIPDRLRDWVVARVAGA